MEEAQSLKGKNLNYILLLVFTKKCGAIVGLVEINRLKIEMRILILYF